MVSKKIKTLEAHQVSNHTRYVPLIRGKDSLHHALHQMQKHKATTLITQLDHKRYGFITEAEILEIFIEGTPLHATVHQIIRREAPIFLYHRPKTEVFKNLTLDQPIAVILDAQEEYMGFVSLSDLCSLVKSYPSPLAGIATPFGIYLTNGGVSAGAPWWILAITGVLLVFIMQGCYLISNEITVLLFKIEGLSRELFLNLLPGTFLCFLILFKISPLSSIHGAEHMVIHALERGEPLEISYVSKMPRIHSRCGTNLSISLLSGLGVYFLGIGKEISPGMLGLGIDFILGAAFSFLMGTNIGNFIQLVFTTKKPSKGQLNSAIEVGKRLNESYQKCPIVWPNFFLRIQKSGIIWILFGSIVAFWFLSFTKIL